MDNSKLRIGLILALLALPALWIASSLTSATPARAAVLPPVSTACKVPSSSDNGTLNVQANGQGEKGEVAIVLSVADTGDTVTLKDVRDALVASGNGDLLTLDAATHTWTLNRSLLVKEGVTLRIAGGAAVPDGERVDWLRMRSDPGTTGTLDYNKFASLRVRDAAAVLDHTRITSWDTVANAFDTNYDDGRAYVLAKGEASIDIASSELSYLGSADGESYGVSWRDNEFVGGDPRTCATGDITDSVFAHNYYGVYTFQAANMQFLRNAFRDNVQYGFDPHDYTHDVLVQDNVAEGNGAHGFIISRGCFSFTFRNNISRNNKIKPGSKNPSAHGFMLDPGSPNSGDPQSPSVANLFENNQAYGNDGYGFRILGSDDNTIQNNLFHSNRLGITLEDGSAGNQIVGNQVLSSTGILSGTTLSQGYGISLNGGADANTLDGNTVRGNRNAGIYVRRGTGRRLRAAAAQRRPARARRRHAPQ
jgi:parallel beta-helix repeat protein